MGLYEVGGRFSNTEHRGQDGDEAAALGDLFEELRALEALGLVQRMPDTIGEPRFGVTDRGRRAARNAPGPGPGPAQSGA